MLVVAVCVCVCVVGVARARGGLLSACARMATATRGSRRLENQNKAAHLPLERRDESERPPRRAAEGAAAAAAAAVALRAPPATAPPPLPAAPRAAATSATAALFRRHVWRRRAEAGAGLALLLFLAAVAVAANIAAQPVAPVAAKDELPTRGEVGERRVARRIEERRVLFFRFWVVCVNDGVVVVSVASVVASCALAWYRARFPLTSTQLPPPATAPSSAPPNDDG